MCSMPICFARAFGLKDDAITIRKVKPGVDTYIFLLNSKRTIEATVTFKCNNAKNLKASHLLPYSFEIHDLQKEFEVIRLLRDNPLKTIDCGKWEFHYKFGIPSKEKTVNYPYSLPYATSEKHLVYQSFGGKASHGKGQADEYSIDFKMPEGTVVEASRPGTVIAYRDDSDFGGDDPNLKGCENYVVIKHGDGTYGIYDHLKKNGVLVKLGQQVTAGGKLALSGATGWANLPHLHFSVYRVRDGYSNNSIPFRMAKGKVLLPPVLKQGSSY